MDGETSLCQRTTNSRLCSLYFCKEQVAHDPEKMKEFQNGYLGAQIRLRTDSVPDIITHAGKAISRGQIVDMQCVCTSCKWFQKMCEIVTEFACLFVCL
jgi:enamine deaminase RidA (YjgF/YER057c/UK114 family)